MYIIHYGDLRDLNTQSGGGDSGRIKLVVVENGVTRCRSVEHIIEGGRDKSHRSCITVVLRQFRVQDSIVKRGVLKGYLRVKSHFRL